VTIGGTVSPAGGNFEEPVTQATLKVVGAFHGLSRERAEARRFPAIDPLESWSKYRGTLPPEQVKRSRDILLRGDETRQMMTVVGEEGVSIEDYVVYLKSELIDEVFLQQNSFDDVDGFCSADRQKHVFSLLSSLVEANFGFQDKNEARSSFSTIRQKFIDWNYAPLDSDDYQRIEREVQAAMPDMHEPEAAAAAVD
jgi:V/A-type H+-transporting ATPase subunit A